MSADGRRVVIYTDGSCAGNPGPGGWAAILTSHEGKRLLKRKDLTGHHPETTTNNRMELVAAISALKAVNVKDRPVILYSDSDYVVKGITEWLPDWKRRGWKSAKKKPVKNVDLWQTLEPLSDRHNVDWRWVRGHNGNALNVEADRLASEQAAIAQCCP